MKIALGCDHRGRQAIDELMPYLAGMGHEVVELGSCDTDGPCDYPDRAWEVADAIRRGEADRGILVCGTGIGMSIAANRHPGIRAALATDPFMSRMAREHNDANVLCLGGRVIGPSLAFEVVDSFLHGVFEGGRHARRIEKIEPA